MITFDSPGTNHETARTAGLLYLIVVVTGIFSLTYVPSQIMVRGNASATVGNILASETLFRLGIVTGLISDTVFMGCFGYLIDFVGSALSPGYSDIAIARYVMLPATFGEIGTCLWLLIIGVGPKVPRQRLHSV